jgi:CheY-like chemotaxis protein
LKTKNVKLSRVLIIDDDPISCELVASILRDGGYDTVELPSPIGATKLIRKRAIDVVILDVMMPELSGDKVAKILRSHADLERLLIVLVSSCPRDQLLRLAHEVRADAVVSKEDVRKTLLAAVKHAEESRKRTTGNIAT